MLAELLEEHLIAWFHILPGWVSGAEQDGLEGVPTAEEADWKISDSSSLALFRAVSASLPLDVNPFVLVQ